MGSFVHLARRVCVNARMMVCWCRSRQPLPASDPRSVTVTEGEDVACCEGGENPVRSLVFLCIRSVPRCANLQVTQVR
jgi:hypothetical protein